MKFSNVLIVVSNLEKSIAFYKDILGLRAIADFGANVTLTGGVCLQTMESYFGFINGKTISFGGNDSELYFEEDDFDNFVKKLKEKRDIDYVHEVKEHAWGQRVVRIYDPDKHIIEIGETMKIVVKRFWNSGLTVEQISKRMDVPVKYVERMMR